ncbi:hypothetical protein BSKO_07084 [Bryopsis sp. KO-2023]|nr:hypothetical protein BSKO_07084 [Bryopsis sp. KO-2023]
MGSGGRIIAPAPPEKKKRLFPDPPRMLTTYPPEPSPRSAYSETVFFSICRQDSTRSRETEACTSADDIVGGSKRKLGAANARVGECKGQGLRNNSNETSPHSLTKPIEQRIDEFLLAKNMAESSAALHALWTPAQVRTKLGTLLGWTPRDVILQLNLLHAKLLALLASGEDRGVHGAADILALSCVDECTRLVLEPSTVVRSLTRLLKLGKSLAKEGAVRCFRNLCVKSEEYAETLLREGILDRLLDFARPSAQKSMLAYVCCILVTLFRRLDDSDAHDVACKWVTPLLGVVSWRESQDVAPCALDCLACIAERTSISEDILQFGGLASLGQLLTSSQSRLQGAAIKLAVPLLSTNEPSFVEFLPPRICPKILTFLQENDEADVQLCALKVLHYAVKNEKYDGLKGNASTKIRILSKIITQGPSECQKLATDVLVSLAANLDGVVQELASESGIIPSLVGMIPTGAAPLRLLSCVLSYPSTDPIQDFIRARGIEVTCDELDKKNSPLLEPAMDVLVSASSHMAGQIRLTECGGLVKVMDWYLMEECSQDSVARKAQVVVDSLVCSGRKESSMACITSGISDRLHQFFKRSILGEQQNGCDPQILDCIVHVLGTIVLGLAGIELGARMICERCFLSYLVTFAKGGKEKWGRAGIESGRVIKRLLDAPCRATCIQILTKTSFLVVVECWLGSSCPEENTLATDLLLRMAHKGLAEQVVASGVIRKLCMLLRHRDACVRVASMCVLCAMSKVCLTDVCSQIVKSRSANSVWRVSGELPLDSADGDILWKMSQRIRSLKVSLKDVERQRKIAELEIWLERGAGKQPEEHVCLSED